MWLLRQEGEKNKYLHKTFSQHIRLQDTQLLEYSWTPDSSRFLRVQTHRALPGIITEQLQLIFALKMAYKKGDE